MPFRRYVEIGRVAMVNYGPKYGKLVVIVDVVDQNRALVDAPDMVRTAVNFKRLSLTDIKIDIPRMPKKKQLKEAMDSHEVQNKWECCSWGRKLMVQKKRASLNDFERFKVMVARIKILKRFKFNCEEGAGKAEEREILKHCFKCAICEVHATFPIRKLACSVPFGI